MRSLKNLVSERVKLAADGHWNGFFSIPLANGITVYLKECDGGRFEGKMAYFPPREDFKNHAPGVNVSSQDGTLLRNYRAGESDAETQIVFGSLAEIVPFLEISAKLFS
ncbi:MAG TPA: hypothetical protein PKA63_12425 [Oligoflexia bacterium]|nr:hypothetical protein [Oligoflexia bacterium]HMP49462.1 hypothetical protein [Oligoflexia bacterium]